MIIGLGMDITETARIGALMERSGDSFAERILAEDEKQCCRMTPEHLAGRWAAKEAVAKALGCGFGKECAIREIHISNNASGMPQATLSGTALQRLHALGGSKILLTITHEKNYAAAVAVIES